MAKPRKGATRHLSQEAADGRHGFRGIAALLFVTGVIAALTWGGMRLMEPKMFPVSTVRVENALEHLSQQAVRNAVLPHVKQGFLRVDVDRVRGELEQLPWVAKASVRRAWPDVLTVRIEEQQAAARWSGGGLVNPQGEVFAPGKMSQWQNLPLLRGPKQTEKILMQEYMAMQGMLTPLGLRISHLTMNERRAWSMNLDNGLKLRLGRNDSRVRLLRFVRVYARVLHPRLESIDSVDLRYTNGFAVRWRADKAAA